MADTASKSDTPIADKVAEAVATDTPAAEPQANEAVAKQAAPEKKVARKAAPNKAAKKKASPKKPAAKTTSSKTSNTTSQSKEPKMATKKTETNATNAATDMFADLSDRAQGAYDKTREFAGEAVEFSKGNVEAIVESGKILGEGMQSMAKDAVESGRGSIEAMTADAKDFAAVRSPSELVQLNSTIASRNFDAMVAQTSKNVEAWTKLATEAFAPIQNRVSIAVEKARTAA